MYQQILSYVPDTWEFDNSHSSGTYRKYIVGKQTPEFNDVQSGIRNQKIIKLVRIQNIHDVGQLLLKEQVLAIENPDDSFYRERRYIVIDRNNLPDALEYNIDYRRCNLPSDFGFDMHPPIYVGPGKVLLVVQVVTNEPYASHIMPEMSNEYFIEYVAYMQW